MLPTQLLEDCKADNKMGYLHCFWSSCLLIKNLVGLYLKNIQYRNLFDHHETN